MDKLGRVTQLSPLEVRAQGEQDSTPAEPLSDFTGATASVTDGTEVLIRSVESRRFAQRIYT